MAEQELPLRIESLIRKTYSGVGADNMILSLLRNHPKDKFSITEIYQAVEVLVKQGRIYLGRSNRYHLGYERQN